MIENMVDVVNIVATGDVGQELDLEALYVDIGFSQKEYNPETAPALQLRSVQDGPVIILYSSGAYNIMGARREKEIEELYNTFTTSLEELGIHVSGKSRPEVQNIVCKAELKQEIDLSALTVALGMGQVEYEPEQSPFVYYWPDNLDCLITIPANGQVIITGVKTEQAAIQAFSHLQDRVKSAFPK